jgi:hypothetical protein
VAEYRAGVKSGGVKGEWGRSARGLHVEIYGLTLETQIQAVRYFHLADLSFHGKSGFAF